MQTNQVIIFTIVVVAVGLAVLLARFFINQLREFQSYAVGRLNNAILPIKNEIEEYKFYTTGHPYVWVESSYEELCTTIKSMCNSVPSQSVVKIIGPANVFVKVNQEKRAIYVVVTEPIDINNRWPDLMHYDEWLESNKSISENIIKYAEKNA